MSLFFIQANAKVKNCFVKRCVLKRVNQFAKERIHTRISVMLFAMDAPLMNFKTVIQKIIIIKRNLNLFKIVVVHYIMNLFVDLMEKFITISVI